MLAALQPANVYLVGCTGTLLTPHNTDKSTVRLAIISSTGICLKEVAQWCTST